MNKFSEKLFKLLIESDKRKATNEMFKKEEDCEEDEKDVLEEDTQ